MKKLYSFIAITWLSLSTISAFAGALCPASTVGGTGIGDGCSTTYGSINLGNIPQIGIFRSTFTPSCDNHDKCLTTLGTTVGQCNGNFLSDMSSACKSSYLPFQPDVYTACMSSASAYRAAVDLYMLSLDTTAFPSLQSNALGVSRQLETAIKAGTCGTTPEATTLYSPSLISTIYTAFNSYSGRYPTIYEFLQAINYGDIVNDPAGWTNNLVAYAKQEATVHPPSVTYVVVQADPVSSAPPSINVSPVISGAAYFWNIDGFPTSTGTSKRVGPVIPPRYNTTKLIQGYVKATLNQGTPQEVSNIAVINTYVFTQGSCSPSPQIPCQ